MLIADRYETLELLGEGGMGEVFLALDRSTGDQVAIKLLKEEVNEDIVVRFDRECALLSRMSHPALVRVLDRGASEKRVFYAMEYVPWPTLSQRISDRFRSGQGFSPREVLTVMRVLAGALDHLHSLDVVHRDLKPSNLLVSDTLDVRVIDFGLAGMLADRMTRTGAVLGSMLYLSPEQIRADKSLDKRSDVFQVGLILFEMLTGQKAYSDVIAYVKKVRLGQPPFPSVQSVNPAVPGGVGLVVMRALSVSPDERPASAGELVEQLEAAVTAVESGVAARPLALPPPAPPRDLRSGARPIGPIKSRATRGPSAAGGLASGRMALSRPAPAGPPPASATAWGGWIASLLAAVVLIGGALAWLLAGDRRPLPPIKDVEVTAGFFRTEMRWATDEPVACSVAISRGSEGARELAAASEGASHVVTFVDLEAGSSYRVQVMVGGSPAGPPVVVDVPGQPVLLEVAAEPSPDGTLLRFRTPVACTATARWQAADATAGTASEGTGAAEQHRLLLPGFRARGPFHVDLRCTSRLGEVWSPARQTVSPR